MGRAEARPSEKRTERLLPRSEQSDCKPGTFVTAFASTKRLTSFSSDTSPARGLTLPPDLLTKLGFAANPGRHETGVLGGHQVCSIPFLALHCLDRRLDVAHQRLHVAGSRIAVQGSFDSAASLVAENEYEAGTEVCDRVFDTAQSVVINKIASGADNKKITDVLVEDDFRCSPRV